MDPITTVTEFTRRVREIENTWIPMPDGAKLAARIWLPEDATADPVPAILEYLPYRKRDGTVERDALTHPYFAGHGYAGVRVDLRGTGDSEGVCTGEYLRQELDDGMAVIAWLAAQPWCSGAVGMIGISWGGFNGLQIAARRPPALKAVISLCSTDDRYADDIHFMGGAVLTDKLAWGATALAIAMTPPDPAIVGDRWRAMWLDRLRGNGLWLLDWFRHQRRDGFWRHGSVCEDYAAIQVPVYAVGGWADGYTNAIFRLLEKLPGPRKGLIGPWAHKYPHFAKPGPRIGFLQECLRWWDQHLRGIETGIMAEPMLRAWINDPVPPRPFYDTRPGAWVAEPGWPAPGVTARDLTLAPGALVDAPVAPAALRIASPVTTGVASGVWCSYGAVADQPLDQRADSGGSLVFDYGPLDAELVVLGFPVLEAEVASDAAVATLVATLSSVAPDGAATQVSYGVLNLTHRDGDAAPQPMRPGQPVQVRLRLNACGQRFVRGDRLRLALSTAYWPVIWPAPTPVTLTVTAGSSRLLLPCRAPRAGDAALAAFARPEAAAAMPREVRRAGGYLRRVTTELTTGRTLYERLSGAHEEHHPHTGLTLSGSDSDCFSIVDGDPASAAGACVWTKRYRRGDWMAQVHTEVRVQALEKLWRITARVAAEDADGPVFARDWAEDIPRDLA